MSDDATVTRFAGRLRWWTIAFAGGLAAVTAVGVLFPSRFIVVHTSGLPREWGLWVAVVVVALVVLALIELTRMLRQIEQGRMFAPAATRHFRSFARYLLWSALVRVLVTPLVGMAAVGAGAHDGPLPGLDDRNLTMLLLSALLFLIARLFDEAARFAEDSRAIV